MDVILNASSLFVCQLHGSDNIFTDLRWPNHAFWCSSLFLMIIVDRNKLLRQNHFGNFIKLNLEEKEMHTCLGEVLASGVENT